MSYSKKMNELNIQSNLWFMIFQSKIVIDWKLESIFNGYLY